MPRRGPSPLELHAMIEPFIGLVFILAPFVLGFSNEPGAPSRSGRPEPRSGQ